MWQQYFSDDAYEDVKIPEDLKVGVKSILWVDSDGSDSQGLIKPDLFGSVRFANIQPQALGSNCPSRSRGKLHENERVSRDCLAI
jgi:hypothetical protein